MLFEELDALQARGVDTSRLVVSASAHVIPPYNRTLDKVTERFLGSRKIGTTGRGIGPTYADKMNRIGIRVQDLYDEKILEQKVTGALEQKNQLLVKVYNRRAVEIREVLDELLGYADRLKPMVADTSLLLNKALDDGKTVLMEAGQATLLDVDHGTYPFVTSSNAISAGACTGTGIPPTRIDRVMAVVKAYTTRVGEGPFPTELLDADGEWLRQQGFEFGTTTGRPRRCGWYDSVIARYAARVNGVSDFVLTKLDTLTGRDKIPVCVAYDVNGVRHDEMPMTQTDFHHADAGLRGVRRLVRRHHRLPQLRRPPEGSPDLRPRRRVPQRRPHLRHRRRPRTPPDRPALSSAGLPVIPMPSSARDAVSCR